MVYDLKNPDKPRRILTGGSGDVNTLDIVSTRKPKLRKNNFITVESSSYSVANIPEINNLSAREKEQLNTDYDNVSTYSKKSANNVVKKPNLRESSMSNSFNENVFILSK